MVTPPLPVSDCLCSNYISRFVIFLPIGLPRLGLALSILSLPPLCSFTSASLCASRYLYPFVAEEPEESLFLHWDAEIGTTQDIWIAFWVEDIAAGTVSLEIIFDEVGNKAPVTTQTQDYY